METAVEVTFVAESVSVRLGLHLIIEMSGDAQALNHVDTAPEMLVQDNSASVVQYSEALLIVA